MRFGLVECDVAVSSVRTGFRTALEPHKSNLNKTQTHTSSLSAIVSLFWVMSEYQINPYHIKVVMSIEIRRPRVERVSCHRRFQIHPRDWGASAYWFKMDTIALHSGSGGQLRMNYVKKSFKEMNGCSSKRTCVVRCLVAMIGQWTLPVFEERRPLPSSFDLTFEPSSMVHSINSNSGAVSKSINHFQEQPSYASPLT